MSSTVGNAQACPPKQVQTPLRTRTLVRSGAMSDGLQAVSGDL